MHIPRTVLLTRRHAGTVTTSSSGRIRHQHRRVYHVTSATAASCLVVAAAALSMSVAVLCDCNDGIHQNHADGINDDDDGGGGIGIVIWINNYDVGSRFQMPNGACGTTTCLAMTDDGIIADDNPSLLKTVGKVSS